MNETQKNIEKVEAQPASRETLAIDEVALLAERDKILAEGRAQIDAMVAMGKKEGLNVA